MKKKLLAVCDAPVVSTGFGQVSKNILDRLHKSGEYEIHVLGINYHDEYHTKPYRIYTATARKPSDLLGIERLAELYATIQPDVVWLFQDFFHINKYIEAVPQMKNICVYFPVDAPNIKSNYAAYLIPAANIATYTKFGAEETVKSLRCVKNNIMAYAHKTGKNGPPEKVRIKTGGAEDKFMDIGFDVLEKLCNRENIDVIPHGIDTSVFYPIDKKEARKFWGFEDDWFIVANTNRNQSRKRLDLTIQAFSEFAKDKPNARLVLHDPLINNYEGWDLVQLADEFYGCHEKVIVNIVNPDNGSRILTEAQLNLLYNSVDVMVNSGGGEGWGLISMESAACRIPQLVPDYSATKEIWSGAGGLIPVVATRAEPQVNTIQCVISTETLTLQLNTLYDNPFIRGVMASACYDVSQKPEYNWDNIAAKYKEIFDRVATGA
jgi:glycosyltransferase involved in cell wall biosynthesis